MTFGRRAKPTPKPAASTTAAAAVVHSHHPTGAAATDERLGHGELVVRDAQSALVDANNINDHRIPTNHNKPLYKLPRRPPRLHRPPPPPPPVQELLPSRSLSPSSSPLPSPSPPTHSSCSHQQPHPSRSSAAALAALAQQPSASIASSGLPPAARRYPGTTRSAQQHAPRALQLDQDIDLDASFKSTPQTPLVAVDNYHLYTNHLEQHELQQHERLLGVRGGGAPPVRLTTTTPSSASSSYLLHLPPLQSPPTPPSLPATPTPPRRRRTVEYSPSSPPVTAVAAVAAALAGAGTVPTAAGTAAAVMPSPAFMFDEEVQGTTRHHFEQDTLSYSDEEYDDHHDHDHDHDHHDVAAASALAQLVGGHVTSSHVYTSNGGRAAGAAAPAHAFPTPPQHAQPELTRDEVEFARFSKFLARATTQNAGAGGAATTTEAYYRQFASRPSASAAGHMTGIYNLTDDQLSDRFDFVNEVGFGNWGSVWVCKLRDPRSSMMRRNDPGVRLGRMAAMNGGVGAGGCVAIKLVHRSGDKGHKQRITALWREMKIIRSLRHEPHPSIIQFEAFVITPTYALIIMPYLAHTIPIKVPFETARPWFRALSSAVAYLHERGITHNDIKPPNIVMNYNDAPVLVDFGFANKHDPGSRSRFLSVMTLGTPEYLDPQRATGAPHDERAADVWALGVTFYEVIVGRTPFEWDDEESFEGQEALEEYWHRTRLGEWLGHYNMPAHTENLLRYMICPDPIARITAIQAYHHRSLQPTKASVSATPIFIREALYDRFDEEGADESFDSIQAAQSPAAHKLKTVKSDMTNKRRKKQRPATALGQATSFVQLRPARTVPMPVPDSENEENIPPPTSAPVQRVTRLQPKKDGTPTKQVKPLRVQEIAAQETKVPRTSPAEAPVLQRPASAAAVLTKMPSQRFPSGGRTCLTVQTFESPPPAANRDEAHLRSMRSLEGVNAREDAVAKAMRSLEGNRTPFLVLADQPSARGQSPSRHNRATSLDLAQELDKKEKAEIRRSAGLDRLASVAEAESDTSLDISFVSHPRMSGTPGPHTPPRFSSKAPQLDVTISSDTVISPITLRGSPASRGSGYGHQRVMSEDVEVLRPRGREPAQFTSADLTVVSRFRGELPRPKMVASPGRMAKQSTAPETVRPSDDNLDRLADWAKTVERYVDAARKAKAEGIEMPAMPAMPDDLGTISLRPVSPSSLAPATPAFSSFTASDSQITAKEVNNATRGSRPKLEELFDVAKQEPPPPAPPAKNGHHLRRAIKRIPTRRAEMTSENRFGTAPANMYVPRIVEPKTPGNTSTWTATATAVVSTDFAVADAFVALDPKGAPYTSEKLLPPAPPQPLGKPNSMANLREKARSILQGHGGGGDRERNSRTLPRSARFQPPPYSGEEEMLSGRQTPTLSGRQTPATGRQTPATLREKRSGLLKLLKWVS